MGRYNSTTDLSDRVIEAMKHTNDALAYFEVFRYVAAPTTHRRYKALFRRYNPLFTAITASSLFGLILSLYKPLEQDSSRLWQEPVDLRRILALGAREKVLSTETHKQMKYRLRSVSYIWKRVAQLRHRLVAHGLAGLSVRDEIQKARLDSGQCRKLALAYAEVLNCIAHKIGLQTINVVTRRRTMASSIEDLLETLDDGTD